MTDYPMIEVAKGVWRGPRPELEQIPAIVKHGVHFVLDLESLQFAEREEFTDCGAELIECKWSEILPPSIRQLTFAAEEINAARYRGILVHCTHGVDRTGAAVLAYRVKFQGWTFDEAYREMLDMGHNVFFYWWWKKRLKDFARRCGR